MNKQLVKNNLPIATLEALEKANELSERMIKFKKAEIRLRFLIAYPNHTDEQWKEFNKELDEI